MYAYYGTISWQIFAILLGAAIVIAPLPLAISFPSLIPMRKDFGLFTIAISSIFVIIGWLSFERNQYLADQWARYFNYYDFISYVEKFKRNNWRSSLLGRGNYYALILFVAIYLGAIGYILLCAT